MAGLLTKLLPWPGPGAFFRRVDRNTYSPGRAQLQSFICQVDSIIVTGPVQNRSIAV